MIFLFPENVPNWNKIWILFKVENITFYSKNNIMSYIDLSEYRKKINILSFKAFIKILKSHEI